MSKEDKSAYFEARENVVTPQHIEVMFNNCKTKLRHAVSKVTIEGNCSDSIAREILDWLTNTKPIVIYKGSKSVKLDGRKYNKII